MHDEAAVKAPPSSTPVEGPIEMPLEEFNALMSEPGRIEAYLTAIGRTWQGAAINPNTGIVTL